MFPVFFFTGTATAEIYTLSLHDALPICAAGAGLDRDHLGGPGAPLALVRRLRQGTLRNPQTPRPRHGRPDRKSTRLNSSHVEISYAVFCLKKKKKTKSHLSSITPTSSRI